MKRGLRLFLRFIGVTIAVFVGVLVIFVVAVNIYCSDEKIREIISEYSDSSLSVNIDAGEYIVSPLRRFPSMTLSVRDLIITSDRVNDSLYVPVAEDTLLKVKQADIAMSALPLLAGRFVFAGIFVDSIGANFTVFPDSTSNWDLVIENSQVDTIAIVVDEDSGETSISGIAIRQFVINGADILYDDRVSGQYARLNGGSLELRGGMSKQHGLFLDVDFDSRSVNYTSQGEHFVDDLSIGLQGKFFIKNDSSAIILNKTKLRLNNIDVTCNGSIFSDTSVLDGGAILDLNYSLDLPELNELWRVVPHRYSQFAQEVEVSGIVRCNGNVYGKLNNNELPHIDGEFMTQNVCFHHKDMLGRIDTLDIRMLLDLDLNNPNNQNLVLHRMNMVGTGIKAKLNGQISQLITDPHIQLRTELSVDAEKMLALFPDTLGVVARGDIDGNLRLNFKLSDIQSSNYGKIRAGGRLSIPHFCFELPADSVGIHIDSASMFLGTGMGGRRSLDEAAMQDTLLTPLGGSLRWKHFEASLKKGNVFYTDSVRVSLRTVQVADTNAIVPLKTAVMWQNLRVLRYDSAWLSSKYLSLNADLKSDANDKKIPTLVANLRSDSLLFSPFRDRLFTSRIDVTIDAKCKDVENSAWTAISIFTMKNLSLYTMFYPLEIKSKLFKVATDANSFSITGNEMRVGRSDFELKGRVFNAWNWLWKNDTVAMKLNVNSNRININQLLMAMDEGNQYKARLDSIHGARAALESTIQEEGTDEVAVELADTTSPIKLNNVYVVAEKYRVDCDLNAKSMVLGRWRMQNAKALLNVNDGVVKLSEMSVNSSIGDILARGVYTAEDTTKAFAGFAMSMKSVQIGNLLDVVPQFDTVMPMLTSLSGKVNVDFAVAGNWDQDMRVDMNSLNGAACIDGKDLVLMDGETFSTIAKKLKFKNKKRNLIDTLSVTLSMSEGMVDIYPFVFKMDRYRAAVGGKQGLDMSYEYHISILDSPIPFKFGLTISGNGDDMKFKITKAKYKDLMKPTSKYNVQQIRVDLKEKISGFLDEIKNQSYALPRFTFVEEDDSEDEMSDEELQKALENYNEEE